MTKLSLHEISLAACGGVAALMMTLSIAVPADAAIGRSKFRASPEDVRRHCWRLDEDFWKTKRNYGCGDMIRCAKGMCVEITVKLPPPPPPPPPPQLKREGRNGDGGRPGADGGTGNNGNNGNNGGNNGGGNNGSGAAGGPN